MGIGTAFKLWRTPRPDYLASPWTDRQVAQIIAADVFPGALPAMPLTRDAAIKLPAVAKARNLLVSTIAPLPLRVLDAEGLIEKQPAWATRTDGEVTPWHRMARTVDDLMFVGAAVWSVTRGSDTFPLSVEHVPTSRWKIDQGQMLIDDKPAAETSFIYFPGPTGGILSEADGTIRGGLDLERAWTARVKQPIPALELRETQESNLEDDEIRDIVNKWKKAVRDPEGAVGYVPFGFELVDHGATEAALFENGRNAVRTDVGAFVNINAALLDAAVSESSLTYQTQEGERSEYLTFGAPMWANPIEQRLSHDDIVPRGQRVRFDTGDLIAPAATPTGIPTED